jgi:YbgC/YbaW family acyl-CoA thioester hydrolase
MSKIDLSLFKHTTTFPVRFMDLDVLNHVNNARYLNYLEEARIKYSNDVLDTYKSISDLTVLVARVEIDYLSPIIFGSIAKVYTRVSRLGTKSFSFECVVAGIRDDKETIAAHSFVTLVSFDAKTGKSVELLPDFKEKIKKFEVHLD